MRWNLQPSRSRCSCRSPVTVARSRRRVVTRAVCLDREHWLRGAIGVHRGKVDPVTGGAVLRHERHTSRLDPLLHITLERIQHRLVDCANAQIGPLLAAYSK